MKIVSEENTFILPIENNNILIIETSNYKNELIECLNSYFVSKKKTKCVVKDDEGNVIKMDDIIFVHYPLDDLVINNMELKQKTVFNTSISNMIYENPKMFMSIDKIRENVYGLLTDGGLYKLRKALSKGIDETVDIDVNNFDITSILSMLEIVRDKLTIEDMRLVMFNLLIFVSKNNPILIYVDTPISGKTEKWSKTVSDNVYVLIDNGSISSLLSNYNYLLLSNSDHLVEYNETSDRINTLMYMSHPIVKSNIRFQIKENIELFNEYCDDNSTIFFKNIFQ